MTIIIRAPRPERGWTDFDNKVLRDPRISYRALGLLVRMLSNANGYRTTVVDLQSERDQEGRDAIRSALKELEAAGYLVRRKYRCDGGLWKTQVHVYDTPQPIEKTEDGFSGVGVLENSNTPRTGKPAVGRPAVGLPGLLQKDQQTEQQNKQNTHPAPEGAGGTPPEGGGESVNQVQDDEIQDLDESQQPVRRASGSGNNPPFPDRLVPLWNAIRSKARNSRHKTLKALLENLKRKDGQPLSEADWERLLSYLHDHADDPVAYIKGVGRRGGWDSRALADLANPGETYKQLRQRISSTDGQTPPLAAPDAPRDEDLIHWILAREPVFMDWMLTHHGPVPAQLYQQFGVRLSFERMGLRRLALEFWRSLR